MTQHIMKSRAMSVIGAGVAALTVVGTLAGCGGSGTEVTKDDSGATVIKFGINVVTPPSRSRRPMTSLKHSTKPTRASTRSSSLPLTPNRMPRT